MQRLISYNYLYLLPLLFSAIFSLKSFGLKWPKPYKVFSAFLVVTLLTEVVAIGWKWYWHETRWWHCSKHNLWIYNSMHIFLFGLFSHFYYLMLYPSIMRKLIGYLAPLLIVFGWLEYFFLQSPNAMNHYTLVITNVFCLVLSLAFFRQVLNEDAIVKLTRYPMVWISLGAFIYCSGSLPFFIFFNYLFKAYPTMALSMLYVNHALNIIMYTLYSIAFLCNPHFRK